MNVKKHKIILDFIRIRLSPLFERLLNEKVIITLSFLLILSIFFYPLYQGKIPFPGDLLIGEYVPYSTYEFMGYAPFGFPNKAQGFDILRFIYPAKEFTINALKNFHIPLWNPYILSGNPHMAGLQSGTFYLFNILFLLLDFKFAWAIYIMLQPFLSGIFMYFLLREFKLQKSAALFGSISFAFSAYMVVWVEYGNLGHTIIWLPLILLLIYKNINKVTLAKTVLIIIALCNSILAGYIQTSFYLYIFTFIFTLYLIKSQKADILKNTLIYILIFFIPVILTLFQLLPTGELILLSVRPGYPFQDFIKLLIPKIHLLTILVPDFFGNPATRNYYLSGTYIERVSYIGIAPLLFVFYSLLKVRDRNYSFFLVSAIIIFLLAFDTHFARVIYSLNLPFISTAVPTRIMFIFCFSLSIIAAFGFDRFIASKDGNLSVKSSLVPILVFIIIWVASSLLQNAFVINLIKDNLSITVRNLVLPGIILFFSLILLFLSTKLTKLFKYPHLLFIALTIFELFYFFHKITPFSHRSALYPGTEIIRFLKEKQDIYRTTGYGKARIDTNLHLHEKIYTTDGYEPLHNKRYSELLSTSRDGKISTKLKGSIAEIATISNGETMQDNKYRQKLLNLLGVKYILHFTESINNEFNADTGIFPEDNYKLIWQDGSWQVYENLNVLPRYFLTDTYIVETDKSNIIGLLYDDNRENKTIIIEEKLPNSFELNNNQDKEIKLVSYNPDKSIFKTKTLSPSLLFLSDNYFPGWSATIDKQSVKIYRANYSFRAVVVPKGEHEIVFTYRPQSFTWGLVVSICGLISGLLLIVIIIKRIYVKK